MKRKEGRGRTETELRGGGAYGKTIMERGGKEGK